MVASRAFLRRLSNGPDPMWDRVAETPTCWLWQGPVGPDGYGHLKRGGRAISAHRLAYELARGPIPAGMHVLHSCDVRACCRPSHLFLGTHAANMADKAAKGRAGPKAGHRHGPGGRWLPK